MNPRMRRPVLWIAATVSSLILFAAAWCATRCLQALVLWAWERVQ